MTYENMRGHIKARYGHDPGWCKKVDKMADEQVCAIYYRLVRAGDLVKKKPMKAKEPTRTQYSCYACNSTYVRDNPELQECEFCGNKILKGLVSDENL